MLLEWWKFKLREYTHITIVEHFNDRTGSVIQFYKRTEGESRSFLTRIFDHFFEDRIIPFLLRVSAPALIVLMYEKTPALIQV